jgi:hypothetical protein
VLLCCLAALERFDAMSAADVRKVTFEVAVLGRSGLDVTIPRRDTR